ncbi:MAG: hypothetical protein AMJ93_15540 [Anaerolineae bacterium SM23_84]|nr:MAG: hypothetical protein AMJ93_15540 [Anaerolineae bacterium SM23_84]
MKPTRDVGIVGYGAYVPRYRLPASEVSRVWTEGHGGLPVEEKSVPGLDEDTATMAIEAARNAMARGGISPQALRAVWVGSESHPYAVKPTSTIVAEAIGATPQVSAADWEFACKAGTEALQAAIAFVGSGMADYAMAIGMDTAQGRPGDALEYTAAAGGAAYIIGPREQSLAYLEGSCSYVTDTPDFFRRAYQHYPEHAGRFTGQPAYFKHTTNAVKMLLDDLSVAPSDFAAAVFHQPNTKFPQRVAKTLGFAILDEAKPGDRILIASFGSGAGSDAFSFVVTDWIKERQALAPSTQAYIARRKPIDYALYVRYRRKLQVH